MEQDIGAWGDVEWHTSSHAEPPLFYADCCNVRDVLSKEGRGAISVNEWVCGYGRASNQRDCQTVMDTSVSCTVNGYWEDRMVAMWQNRVFTVGDSGGGWSNGNKAYGLTMGQCTFDGAARNVWSVADLLDEAMNVVVRTK